jgi:predicted enzyme involved in methoxymalonyl-ACP biosynthesis
MLHLDLWLMSCRVIKRDMELAMLDVLACRAKAMGIRELRGYYSPTKKNSMVSDHYEKLGFSRVSTDTETRSSVWSLSLADYSQRSQHIRISEPVHG